MLLAVNVSVIGGKCKLLVFCGAVGDARDGMCF